MAEARTAPESSAHFVVVVLGDVGRSPRMQYHALSLLNEGFTVSLVGYEGEELIPDLPLTHERLHVVRFTTSSPKWLRTVLPLFYIWRLLSLVSNLMWALWIRVPRDRPAVDCVLVQNPPAIPLLLVARMFCYFRSLTTTKQPRLVIDWHNLGYSMLNPGKIRRLAEWYERIMAPLAHGHLCVTSAMQQFLKRDMKLENVAVLYDCPPDMFRPLTIEQQHEFLLRTNLTTACPRSWYESLDLDTQTMFTEQVHGKIQSRSNRPALVTSSTSWTEDEDFGLLLEGLATLDARLTSDACNLCVLVLVTGKGPLKAAYEEKISKLTMTHVAIQTLWLEPGDYPQLLACADVGISLHTSTSGLDLPMKVLDLFGCETPVCAMGFACLPELVQDQINGRVFHTSDQLSDQLHQLLSPLSGPPHSYGDLLAFSRKLQGRTRWTENWKEHALPALMGRLETAPHLQEVTVTSECSSN
jgi:beta-1,4-mannosyltransferase